MTEFKGKDGEGMRDFRAAAGVLETGGHSPAGRKYGGGPQSVLAPRIPSPVCEFLIPRAPLA